MSVEHFIIIKGGGAADRRIRNRPYDTLRRPDLLARRLRGGGQWRFYDFGTRLQSKATPSTFADAGRNPADETLPTMDGSQTLEYVELAFDAPGQFTDVKTAIDVPPGETDVYSFTSNHTQIAAENPSTVLGWDAQMLGTDNALDPLAFTDSTGEPVRKVSHCMPLWYGFADQPGAVGGEIVRLASTASGGTFTLTVTVGDKTGTTAPIAYNAAPITIKKALLALKSVLDTGDIASIGGNLTDGLDIYFGGRLLSYNLPAIVADSGNLTGGSVTVTVVQDGIGSTVAKSYIEAFDTASYTQSTGYNHDLFDLELYTAQKTNTYPNTTYREIVADVARWWRYSVSDPQFLQDTFTAMVKALNGRWKGEDPKGTGEVWNTLNVTQSGQDISQVGLMEMAGAGGRANVRLNSRLAFEPFDTGDTANYKITAQPDYAAAAVPFKFTQSVEAHFYLKPQLHGFARRLDFQRVETVALSSYRTYDSVVGLWWNRQTSAIAYAPANPNVYASLQIAGSMEIGQGQNPDAGPYTFTVTGTIDRTTGAYTISNLHDGSSVSGTATYIPAPTPGAPGDWDITYYGPNYFVRLQADEYRAIEGATNNLTMNVSTAPQYSSRNTTLQANCSVWRGCHIGRYPAFPKNIQSAGWVAQTLDIESATTTYADGTSKTATFADSVTMPGRELTLFFGSGANARQVYSRRSNRDAKDYVYYRPIVYTDQMPDSGQITERIIATDNQIEWKKLTVKTATQTAINTEATAAIAELKNAILAYDHVATISPVSSSVTFAEPSFGKTWIMLPIDAQTGQLCAVIVQGKNKYYIWRKTAQTRGGYDWERNQGRAIYSGTIA